MSERVVFLRPDAERVARAVRRVESMREVTPLEFPRVVEQGGSGKVFRVASFGTSAWAKNQFRTVTLRYAATTPNTVTVINLFANIATSASTARSCAIARDGTAWHLIAAEC